VIAFIAGAVAGAAVMLAIVAACCPKWEHAAAVVAKQRARQSAGWVLVELAAELDARNAGRVTLPGPHPRHAPTRAAYRLGYNLALCEAVQLVRDAHRLVTGHDAGGRPLHPSEHAA
jgi:hypothetical protein